MPFCKCPICGSTFILSVSVSSEEWYRIYAPGRPTTEPAPIPCVKHFKEWEEKKEKEGE